MTPIGKTMAKAFQASKKTSNGSAHQVGILELRVMLVEEDGAWFAQGLDLDYLAQGTTLTNAQKAFENGLFLTMKEHIKLFGDIQKLLRPAPPEVWTEFFSLSTAGELFEFSGTTGHELSKACEDFFLFAETKTKAPAAKKKSAKQGKLPFSGIQYLKAA